MLCCASSQCPCLHPKWNDPEGVPISAIIFGGRRPAGVPLVFEARSWQHGVLVGASLKSESTMTSELNGRVIKHDPMAMRLFFGYNFGHYLHHWLDMEKPARKASFFANLLDLTKFTIICRKFMQILCRCRKSST